MTKKTSWYNNILNTVKKNVRVELTPREKIELEVIHILVKTDGFVLVKTHDLAFLRGLTSTLSRMQ